MPRIAAFAVLMLLGCGVKPPSEDELFTAVLMRMEGTPVTDQGFLDPQMIVLDEVRGSDRKITAGLLPSAEKWRVVTREELQREADARGKAVYVAALQIISSEQGRVTIEIEIFPREPTGRNEIHTCCCGTEEVWNGASGRWTFESRRLAWCA